MIILYENKYQCLRKSEYRPKNVLHIKRRLNGREKCGWRRWISNRDNHSLERILKENYLKNLGRFGGTEVESLCTDKSYLKQETKSESCLG